MKYINEFRDPDSVKNILAQIHKSTKQAWNIMEVCGGQTHTIVKYQLIKLLPDKINLIHGPGCPVCVTPEATLDEAILISKIPNVIMTSFGDMLRVPSQYGSLLQARANGSDIKIVYSPLDAIQIAINNPDKEIVFLSIGFETTTAPNALAVLQAASLGLKNFSVLVSQVRVPPAIEAIINTDNSKIDGFLAAGHVCTVMGIEEYRPLVAKYNRPIVVTGFEPMDILLGLFKVIKQLESGFASIDIEYSRSVIETGNLIAKKAIEKVFKIADQSWRGLGVIPQSGYILRNEYLNYDARNKFIKKQILNNNNHDNQAKTIYQFLNPLNKVSSSLKFQSECGEILKGIKKPPQCTHFGKNCKPDLPLGAPMVSTEGACAAYYNYLSIY